MTKRLLGTTALLGATMLVAAGGSAWAKNCPPTTDSKGQCNWAGSPTPFVVSFNLDADEQVAGQINAANPASGSKRRDIGFLQDAYLEFRIDGSEGDWHYGYNFNLFTTASSSNNTVSGTPSNTTKDAFYIKHPKYGFFSVNNGVGTAWTHSFPMTIGPGTDAWGPRGSSQNNIGPDNGTESQFIYDPTGAFIDAAISPVGGADLYRPKGEWRLLYDTPHYLGSDEDHGVDVIFEYDLDGVGNAESFFHPTTTGNQTGPSPFKQQLATGNQNGSQFSNARPFENIIGIGPTWDEMLSKNLELVVAGVYAHGTSKHGDPTAKAAGGSDLALGGGTDPTRKLYKDLNEFNSGIAAIIGDCDAGCLTTGADYSYAGRSMYANGIKNTNGAGKVVPTMKSQGFSAGAQYDWDKYTVGAYYEYAVGQGDFNDAGYIQLQYVAFGGSIKVFKGLKVWNEFLLVHDRFNHSNADIAANGVKRNSDSGVWIFGTSIYF